MNKKDTVTGHKRIRLYSGLEREIPQILPRKKPRLIEKVRLIHNERTSISDYIPERKRRAFDPNYERDDFDNPYDNFIIQINFLTEGEKIFLRKKNISMKDIPYSSIDQTEFYDERFLLHLNGLWLPPPKFYVTSSANTYGIIEMRSNQSENTSIDQPLDIGYDDDETTTNEINTIPKQGDLCIPIQYIRSKIITEMATVRFLLIYETLLFLKNESIKVSPSDKHFVIYYLDKTKKYYTRLKHAHNRVINNK